MLRTMIQTMSTILLNDWNTYLSAFLFAVGKIPQDSIGFSPFELPYGRQRSNAGFRRICSVEEHDERNLSTYQYTIELREAHMHFSTGKCPKVGHKVKG